ncbi:putative Asparagine synthetase [Xenorhabdus bovienii str. kraussei Quebec]|uniref:asparagine synthase (glutamine-hydrolyzing) n=1 Tax=Xenorhabdus bovienii str. kraussei Quebec TaxID=1398203 RepID=A0A077PH35_XENBV|nr:asparagine synthase (glutamine-hydrolyzing) [Xenorhabdus bovienii]CDH20378.1 putative Asparagine synthetase [Xenorhabdus bovienii str. kraussei Quebec]
MCGIFLAISKTDQLLDGSKLVSAAQRMSHRGPDSFSYYQDGRVFMAHARLSIVGGKDAKQPVYNEDQTVASIVNGEIFDYKSLKEDLILGRHNIQSSSDSELICHLYEDFEEKVSENLNGMFSLFIHDRKKNKVVISRDRFGIKPLVYFENEKYIFYCSDIEPILKLSEGIIEIDRESLSHFLTTGYPEPNKTIFTGVNVFLPSTTKVICLNDLSSEQYEYWRPNFPDSQLKVSSEQIHSMVDLFKKNFEKICEEYIDISVPYGVYLSGGLDSSAVYSCIKNTKLDILSLGFDTASFDEQSFQKLMTNGTENQVHVVNGDNLTIEELNQTFRSLECPQVFTLDGPMQRLSKAAKGLGLKVILTGDGADELLGGYNHFEALIEAQKNAHKFSNPSFKSDYIKYLNTIGLSADYAEEVIDLFKDEKPWFIDVFGFLPPWLVVWIFSWRASKSIIKGIYNPFWQDPNSFIVKFCKKIDKNISHLDKSIQLELRSRLPSWTLWRADKNAMANSIEVRPPFLDNRISDFLLKLPSQLKRGLYREKLFLKWSFRNSIDYSIIKRKKLVVY